MNCAEFSELVFDLDRNEGLDETTRQRALAHADVCPRCDEELQMARSFRTAMRTLASSTANMEAPPRVEDALRHEMRQQHAPVAIRPRRRFHWAIAEVATLAAAVLLAVLVIKPGLLGRGNGNVPVAPSSNAQTLPSGASANTGSTPAANTQNSAAADDAQGADTEYATDFVALPSADGTTYAEDQTIVRVSLPPSALASFGLPISSDGHDANVLADFVLGEDGVPQAVRLVQSK